MRRNLTALKEIRVAGLRFDSQHSQDGPAAKWVTQWITVKKKESMDTEIKNRTTNRAGIINFAHKMSMVLTLSLRIRRVHPLLGRLLVLLKMATMRWLAKTLGQPPG